MGLKKCPRCELNYILDDGELCTVCREEVRGKRSKDDTMIVCSVCGEMPALAGEDMCKACLAEIRSIEILTTEEDDGAEAAELEPEPVSGLDEIESVDVLDEDGIEEDIDETLDGDDAEEEMEDQGA